MKGTKRGSKKVKALSMAVNLAACLRLYAPNEKTHVDAIRKAQNANEEGYSLNEKPLRGVSNGRQKTLANGLNVKK